MARISTTARPNNPAKEVSATVYNALVADYVSQTDAAAQATAGAITHAGLQTFNGGVDGIPQPYTFMMLINGADAEAYNSSGALTYGGAADAGAIDGADHSAVFQATINAVEALGGGTIFFAEGDFTYGTNLTVNSTEALHLYLVGTPNTVFSFTSGAGTGLTVGTLGGAGSESQHFRMENIEFSAGAALTNLVTIVNFQQMSVNNIRLMFGGQTVAGLLVQDVLNGEVANVYGQTLTGYMIRVQNNTRPHGASVVVRDCDGYNLQANTVGLDFYAYYNVGVSEVLHLPRAEYCTMTGNSGAIPAGSIGFRIYCDNANGRTDNAHLVNCDTEGCATGFYVDRARGTVLDHCMSTTCTTAFNLGSTALRTVIKQPIFLGTHTTGIAVANGATLTVEPPLNQLAAPTTLIADSSVGTAFSPNPARIQSQTPVDLSGAATVQYLVNSNCALHLVRATLLYTEASSADAGIALKIGKETDDDYYYTGTSEGSKAQYYTANLTLLANDIAAGDTVVFSSAGGKTGTGEVVLLLEWIYK